MWVCREQRTWEGIPCKRGWAAFLSPGPSRAGRDSGSPQSEGHPTRTEPDLTGEDAQTPTMLPPEAGPTPLEPGPTPFRVWPLPVRKGLWPPRLSTPPPLPSHRSQEPPGSLFLQVLYVKEQKHGQCDVRSPRLALRRSKFKSQLSPSSTKCK